MTPKTLALLDGRVDRRKIVAAVTAAIVFGFVFVTGGPADGEEILTATDIGPETGFEDVFFGHHNRGRANVSADFDLDGDVDFYIGNPGDESFVIRNLLSETRSVSFEVVQKLFEGADEDLAWGAVSLDYDNDGDYDLFVTVGGNEGAGFDRLFRNRFVESGSLMFDDVTDTAGVSGPRFQGTAIRAASRNAVAADYNLDGFTDLFVSTGVDGVQVGLVGRNLLWHNNGNGTFSDVTETVGLGGSRLSSQHSTFLDYDNDGDFDLYENNFEGANVLWRNELKETGTATFTDVTAEMSPPGEDISRPGPSFVSAAADFDNDGWEDLMVFYRRGADPDSPYPSGHALFLNQQGTGFVNVAESAGLNAPFLPGVMGCQVGDVNLDGTPDIYVGTGSPQVGEFDELFLSVAGPGNPLAFTNQSALIDYPSDEDPRLTYPPYPYRTHGTTFVDVDGDGLLEIAVVNGGPMKGDDIVREPNRLFDLDFAAPPGVFTVHAKGNGSTTSRDAIGTRFLLEAEDADGNRWIVRRTLFGGSCFSAQNGYKVTFGLDDAVQINRLTILWPDGERQVLGQGLPVGGSMTVEQRPKVPGS